MRVGSGKGVPVGRGVAPSVASGDGVSAAAAAGTGVSVAVALGTVLAVGVGADRRVDVAVGLSTIVAVGLGVLPDVGESTEHGSHRTWPAWIQVLSRQLSFMTRSIVVPQWTASR